MARKKPIDVKYCAYYNKTTGEILGVSNEVHPTLKHSIEIKYNVYEKLVTGQEKLSEYIVGRIKDVDGKKIWQLIPKAKDTYAFRNTLFETIIDAPNLDTELIVTHVEGIKWQFTLSNNAKHRTYDIISNTKIPFFVILSNDYDFLIRNIVVNANDLITRGTVNVPFEFDIEYDINRVSMATRSIFESYGLNK